MDADPEADGDAEADGLGSSVVSVGLGRTDGVAAAELDDDADGEGDGEGDPVRECDGDGDGEGDVEGAGEPPPGSALQVLAVFGDELELDPGAASLSAPARAMVGQSASTPKISRTPVSKLSVVARTCAKRI